MQKHLSLGDIQILASGNEMAIDVLHYFLQAITAEGRDKMLVSDFYQHSLTEASETGPL